MKYSYIFTLLIWFSINISLEGFEFSEEIKGSIKTPSFEQTLDFWLESFEDSKIREYAGLIRFVAPDDQKLSLFSMSDVCIIVTNLNAEKKNTHVFTESQMMHYLDAGLAEKPQFSKIVNRTFWDPIDLEMDCHILNLGENKLIKIDNPSASYGLYEILIYFIRSKDGVGVLVVEGDLDGLSDGSQRFRFEMLKELYDLSETYIFASSQLLRNITKNN